MTRGEQDNINLKYRLNEAERQLRGLTAERPAAEGDAIAAAYGRADSVAQYFGERASQPIAGEGPLQYRRRLLQKFLPHSASFKYARLDALDASALGAVEDLVYADAQTAARNPDTPGMAGKLIERKYTDPAGRVITEFTGDPMVWMSAFMSSGRVGHFDRSNASRKD